MRVLIVGASGLVGRALWQTFSPRHQVRGTFCRRPAADLDPLDMTDRRAVQALVAAQRPEVILLPAAEPNVEHCEAHPEETWAVNVAGVENVAAAAGEVGAGLVYFSSDYIFDGRAGPYAEDDAPAPLNAYGRQKLAGEERVRAHVAEALIVRTTVVYGWEAAGKNFVVKLIEALAAGRPVRAPQDQIGTPTYVRNLAEVVEELVEQRRQGVWNVVGPDLLDRYAFAVRAARAFGLDERLIVPVSTAELGQAARRPLQAGLRVERVQGVLRRTRLLGAEEGLRVMCAEERA